MKINDILSQLGLDLSNPEARRGAIEAIDAILTSRMPIDKVDLGGSMGGSNETEVELDPDLLQPSVKQAPSGVNDDDIEIEDEENILDQIKHKESEEPIENTNSTGDDSESSESDNSQNSENTDSTDASDSDDTEQSGTGNNKANDNSSEDSEDSKDDEPEDSAEGEEDASTAKTSDDEDETVEDSEDETDDTEELENDDQENFKNDEEDEGSAEVDADDAEDDNEDNEENFDDAEDSEEDPEEAGDFEYEEDSEEDDAEDEEDFDFDEDDLIDDELKNSTEDEAIKTKHDARKIKRERTLAAAQKALADAQTKKVAPALIRELENAIAALEALTEAVTKSIKDISDAEFNQLVNRVFDAIDACGSSDLTFTSEEEREAKVKEIKDDMASAQTQAELSAEDAAKIRAETQAIKAREKEIAKYAGPGRGSFKGFQDFLNSLYRAIALQVSTEETRDDSWSAISRRNSGAGVLRQGKKINELPNKKIPVIDFYFDCSGSWGPDDITVGKKAVSALADMENNGQIKVNVYYFSDNVSQNYEDVAGGGTSAWNYIVKNIIATQANNVVIMTDNDMERMGKSRAGVAGHLKYTVPGYVWYLWKNGENAPRLPRDLKGRGGVQQFSFNAGDV